MSQSNDMGDAFGPGASLQSSISAAPPIAESLESQFLNALCDYWDAAWKEGADGRHHDDENGTAQKAQNAVRKTVNRLAESQFEAGYQLGLKAAKDVFERAVQPTDEDLQSDKDLAADLKASIEAEMMQVAQAVARRCAELAEWRGALQKDRAMAEGNDYAGERAIEAEACAAAIRAEFGLEEEP